MATTKELFYKIISICTALSKTYKNYISFPNCTTVALFDLLKKEIKSKLIFKIDPIFGYELFRCNTVSAARLWKGRGKSLLCRYVISEIQNVFRKLKRRKKKAWVLVSTLIGAEVPNTEFANTCAY